MPALQVYEIPLVWSPDPNIFNGEVEEGIQYLAWNIGYSINKQTGLWLIEPVRDEADPLEDLIDVRYEVFDLTGDVALYGHTRSILPTSSILEVQTAFLAEVDVRIDAILASED